MTPPFKLTAEQRAQIDAVRSNDARVMLLQIFHQVHAFAHRDRSLFGMVADPAVFSRVWMANEAAHMEEAWGNYRAMPSARAATPSGLSRFASSAKLASLSQERAA